ncbi:MAG: hypothetical protein A2X67_09840 [Ignavibacteria bacterium GWA2_55_11]|nr:MAG: hypothetical protein A2X67_09840 [Ignavibacteria bacterium GWA2_55_11]OGU69388.1 MAG: hypothetical protein A3H45_01595 [Ignavibacteria bacterium RIFCSPLOWO2_02_FULL_55_14]
MTSLRYVAVVAVFFGCSSSHDSQRTGTTASPAPPGAAQAVQEIGEPALTRFIEGSVLDAKEEYAEAILEYQEALRLEPRNAAIHYAISRDYYELNKLPRAAEFGREAVRLAPDNGAYRENLARIYVGAMQTELAIKEFETVVRLDSMNNKAWYNLARLLQPQKPLRSLEIYEKLMDRDGETLDLLLQTAELYNALGRYDRAVEHYEAMLRIEPSNRALQRQLAETYGKAGKYDDAIRILESIREVSPDDQEVTLVLADFYLDRKETAKAVELFDYLLRQPRVHPEVRIRIGVAYFSQSESDTSFIPRARSIFEEVRALQPSDWRPNWYLGAIAMNQKRDTLAAEYFAEVTRLEPRNADAWWYVGSIYFDRGYYDRVFQTMDRARQVIPNDYRVYFLTGLAYTRLEKQTEAVEQLWLAYKLNSKNMDVLSTLALTLDGLKRYDESDRLYEEALKVDSTNALILNNYSYSLSERGLQLSRALVMASKAVAAEPENPSYLDTIGWVYFMLGDYTRALTYVQKAVDSGEASAVVLEHLGDVYFRLGKKDDAMREWKRALEKSANTESLKRKVQTGTL